jgi:hypothetical protein
MACMGESIVLKKARARLPYLDRLQTYFVGVNTNVVQFGCDDCLVDINE